MEEVQGGGKGRSLVKKRLCFPVEKPKVATKLRRGGRGLKMAHPLLGREGGGEEPGDKKNCYIQKKKTMKVAPSDNGIRGEEGGKS